MIAGAYSQKDGRKRETMTEVKYKYRILPQKSGEGRSTPKHERSNELDTLRENCGIIRKQASTDGGVLWEVMRVNVVQVREKDRSLRDPIEARSCVRVCIAYTNSKSSIVRNEKKSLQGETYRRHSRWNEAGASFNTDPSSDERQMRLNIVKCSN
ncbi:hypothetical protein TNCV_2229421 [Trichonephila clavipes]|nr:hypothetical protein TNCV_2229421 [Trichonephila clavipes]